MSFIPQQRKFWVYHLVGMSIFVSFQWINFSFQQQFLHYNLLATFIALPIFTFSALLFRYVYKQRQWFSLGMAKQIFLVFFGSFIIGIIVVGGLSLVTMPFFWQELFSEETLKIYNVASPIEGFIRFFILKVVAQTSVALLWIFMYIGITYNRRANEAEVNVLRLENSLKEAQMLTLTNQLNPHFLFNSLNNIRFMIHENAEQADDMVTDFSDILRYSLTQGKKEKVTLAQELDIVNRYIDVVSMQLEQRIDYQLSLTLVEKNVLIPPMSLHLLVENAVKHALDHIKETSVLQVDISTTNQQLIMKVVNPLAKRIAAIDDKKSTKTGLNNIKQRLALLYGEQAILLTKTEQQQFIATIQLPLEQAVTQ